MYICINSYRSSIHHLPLVLLVPCYRGDGFSLGALIGLIVGCFVGAVLLAVLVVLLMMWYALLINRDRLNITRNLSHLPSSPHCFISTSVNLHPTSPTSTHITGPHLHFSPTLAPSSAQLSNFKLARASIHSLPFAHPPQGYGSNASTRRTQRCGGWTLTPTFPPSRTRDTNDLCPSAKRELCLLTQGMPSLRF